MAAPSFALTFPPGAALVVGATGALGQAVATAFAQAGTDVVLTHRSAGAGIDSAVANVEGAGGKATTIRCDLRDRASVAKAVDEAFAACPAVHSVVYAAGPDIPIRYVSELDDETWRDAFNTDVHGFFALTTAAIPHLRKAGGAITAISTTATGRYPPKDVLSAAPKAAIETVVKAVAKEEGRYGIRANAVAPGWVGSGLGERIIAAEHGGTSGRLTPGIPLRRLGTATEVASAVLFLCSQQSAYVTGQVLAVDGGWQV